MGGFRSHQQHQDTRGSQAIPRVRGPRAAPRGIAVGKGRPDRL